MRKELRSSLIVMGSGQNCRVSHSWFGFEFGKSSPTEQFLFGVVDCKVTPISCFCWAKTDKVVHHFVILLTDVV